jgi:hypothetical protein
VSPWKLEALRLWRTRRLVALAGAFAILGLGIPILTYELPSLIKNGTGGIQVTVPRQTPLDSLVSFGSNAAQLGTLVLVLVAAGSLALDARPALAAFYRSRAVRPSVLLLPRYAAAATAGVASFVLGIGCAWYETISAISTRSTAGCLRRWAPVWPILSARVILASPGPPSPSAQQPRSRSSVPRSCAFRGGQVLAANQQRIAHGPDLQAGPVPGAGPRSLLIAARGVVRELRQQHWPNSLIGSFR